MRYIIFTYFIFISFNTYAQKEKIFSLKSIRGEFSIILEYSDVTGREATEFARENAKRKALESVCGSHINIWDQMETSSVGDFFNSLSINQIDGEILEFNIKEEGHKQSETRSSETIFYCIADIKVKMGLEADSDFFIAVNGLKSVYYTHDELLFEILPYKECYMKVFLLENEQKGYLLYPNQYDRSQKLLANSKFNIADSQYYEFELTKNSKSSKEINRIMFVFTKTERPFNEYETSRNEIEKWIASIPNNQKYIHCAIIEIRDK